MYKIFFQVSTENGKAFVNHLVEAVGDLTNLSIWDPTFNSSIQISRRESDKNFISYTPRHKSKTISRFRLYILDIFSLERIVLFGLRLSFFCWSIWILAGWIVIWIIICFVDWYYFGWFYLEFVFSGWLDWNLMQVNCIDMHGIHWCLWIIGSLGNWSPSNSWIGFLLDIE